MRITIVGGHGKVALLAEPLFVQAGHEVVALIRRPDQASDIEATGAAPVVADVEHLPTEELADLFRGRDAIVWSAGAGGGNPARTYAVDRDAAIRAVDAAQQAGVGRFVMVSYLGAGRGHGIPEEDSFFAYAEAKAAADEHLRGSGLEWTILGPGHLTLTPGTGRIRTLEHRVGAVHAAEGVPRADVAATLLAVLADPTTISRTIDFTGAGPDGGEPIATAVREQA